MYDQNKKLVDRREMLRIKVKSLMEEARFIRREEKKTFGQLRDELHLHRVLHLRRLTRNAMLAYAIVRGVDPDRVEPIRYTEPNWAEVERMVRKYGSADLVKWERNPTQQSPTEEPKETKETAMSFFGRFRKAS